MNRSLAAFFAVITILSITFMGCSSTPTEPKAIVKEFFSRFAKKDFDGAGKLCSEASQSTINNIKAAFNMLEGFQPKEIDKVFKEIKNVNVSDARISGDSAFVNMKNTTGETTEFLLIKEKGAWKIDLSEASMQRIMSGQNGGRNQPDDFPLDSAGKAEVQRMADSILQNLDPKELEQMKKSLEQLKTPAQ